MSAVSVCVRVRFASVKTWGSQVIHSYLPLIDSCPEVAGLIVEHRSKSEIYYVVDVLRAGHEY